VPTRDWLLLAAGVTVALYVLFVVALLVAGRRSSARALAGFVSDCVVLFGRLLGDERIPRRRKAVLGLLLAYLVMPIDLVPDFIPVAGQLDDAIIVVLGLRWVLRAGGPELVREHWPGPRGSLDVVVRAVFGRSGPARPATRSTRP
jgi:uncharacterized membrane protein YkvA (DUF1232 family)